MLKIFNVLSFDIKIISALKRNNLFKKECQNKLNKKDNDIILLFKQYKNLVN